MKETTYTTPKPQSLTITIRVSAAEYQYCNRLAKEQDRSISYIGRQLLKQGIANHLTEDRLSRKE